MPSHGRVVLVAEDEENDFLLLQWAFARNGEQLTLIRVADGVEAIQYLEGEGAFADRARHPLPDLLILDLKMPRKDGFEVLEWLQNHPTHRTQITVILSSSRQDSDIRRAYQLGANSYLTKPNDSVGLATMSRALIDFWLRWSQRPQRGAAEFVGSR